MAVKEIRAVGVANTVTAGTATADGMWFRITPVGTRDEIMTDAEFRDFHASDTGAVLEVASDGLRISSSALGSGLTGGGASTISIATGGVTYAMIQDTASASRIIGRGSAAGAGDVEELTLDSTLTFTGTAIGVADGGVSYAKVQDVSAASRLLGRGSAGGSGDMEELTIGSGLTLSGTELSADAIALPVADTNAVVKGSVDDTKLLRLEVDGQTTGVTGVLATTFTTAKTITFPDATDTVVCKDTTDTLTNKTINLASNTLTLTMAELDAAISDGTVAFATGAFHDGFSDFVANEHIDHSSVTITIAGTTNQLVVAEGAQSIAASRTYTISLSGDLAMPGTGACTVVKGTTAQQPAGTNGQIRYDTTTDKFRCYENGTWLDIIGSGSANQQYIYLVRNNSVVTDYADGYTTSADFGTQLDAAITAMAAGDTLLVGPGEYQFDGYVVAASDVRLIFHGATLIPNGNYAKIFVVNGDDVIVEGMKIDGGDTANTGAGIGIQVGDGATPKRVILKDCEVSGVRGTSASADGIALKVFGDDTYVENFVSHSPGYCGIIVNANRCTINGAYITNPLDRCLNIEGSSARDWCHVYNLTSVVDTAGKKTGIGCTPTGIYDTVLFSNCSIKQGVNYNSASREQPIKAGFVGTLIMEACEFRHPVNDGSNRATGFAVDVTGTIDKIVMRDCVFSDGISGANIRVDEQLYDGCRFGVDQCESPALLDAVLGKNVVFRNCYFDLNTSGTQVLSISSSWAATDKLTFHDNKCVANIASPTTVLNGHAGNNVNGIVYYRNEISNSNGGGSIKESSDAAVNLYCQNNPAGPDSQFQPVAHANTTLGATPTIDWRNGSHQSGVVSANITSQTWTAPANPGNLTLVLNDTTGYTIAWPSTLKGPAPVVSTNGNTVLSFYYDGTNYWNVTPESGVVNVRTFGATGDGTTDDTTAVTDAITVAQALGVPLYFPKGTYLLSTWSEATTTADLTITGDDKHLVTITGPNTTTNMLKIAAGFDLRCKDVGFDTWQYPIQLGDSTSTDHETIEVRGCKFTNINIAVADTGSANQDTTQQFIVTDCEISGGIYAGIMHRCLNVRRCQVSRNKITNIAHTTNTAQGIQIGQNVDNPGGTIIISENDISDIRTSLASSSTYGILAYGSQVTIANNHVRRTWTDDFTGSFGIYTKAHLSKITGNTLRNAGGSDGSIILKGLESSEAPGAPFGYGSIVSGNSIYATNGDRNFTAIKSYCDRCLITGNTIEGVPDRAFTVDAGTDIVTCTDHRLDTGDIIRVSSTTTLPAGLATATDYFVTAIDVDTFTLSTVSNGAKGSAIDITDTGTGTHSVVHSNYNRGIVTVAPGCVISNNIFHRMYHTTTMAAIEINGAHDILIDGNWIDTLVADGGWAMGVYIKHASGGPWRNFQIVNNRFDDFSGVSDDIGVMINPTAAIEVDNVLISGNHFADMSTAVALNAGICNNGSVINNTYKSITDELKQTTSATDGWTLEVNNVVLDTTNATITSIWTHGTNDDTAYQVEADITAVRTDDYTEAASYKIIGTFRNNSGTLSQVGSATIVYSNEDNAGMNVSMDTSSENLRVRVQGAGVINTTWRANIKLQTVA